MREFAAARHVPAGHCRAAKKTAAGKFQGGHQLARLGESDTIDCTEFIDVQFGILIKALQDGTRYLQDAVAFYTAAKENGQQFRIRKSLSPLIHQFFTGASE